MVKIKPRYWITLIGLTALLGPVLVHIGGVAWRNVQYHKDLKTYSDVLKPGMTRSEVEAYFIMSRYVSFSQEMGSRGAYNDTVEIAQEEEGWFCQKQLVYAVFQFAANEPDREVAATPEDRLVRTSLDRSVCLDLP